MVCVDGHTQIEVGNVIKLNASGVFEPKAVTVSFSLDEVSPETVQAILGRCSCKCHDCCVPPDASCDDCEENHAG